MRYQSISVRGFGHFDDFEASDIHPRLHVVLGPNEAGKSTLREFLRWMLFGAVRGDKARWTNASGKMEGGLVLAGERGPVRIVRDGSDVAVIEGARRFAGQGAVDQVLQGMDPALYQAVHTFDLFDLQKIDALRGERVQTLLAVGATLGGARHPADVLEALDAEAALLWRPRKSDVAIKEAQRRLRELERQLAERQREARQHSTISETIRELEQSNEAARGHIEQWARERHILRRLVDVWPTWSERAAVEAELNALPLQELIDAAVVDRIETAHRAVESATARYHEAEEAFGTACAHVEACPERRGWLPFSAAIVDLDGQREALGAKELERVEVKQAVDNATQQLHAALGRLGEGWSAERVSAIRLSPSLEAEAREHASDTADLVRHVPQALEDARQRQEAYEKQRQRVQAELEEQQGALLGDVLRRAQGLLDREPAMREDSARVRDLAAQRDAIATEVASLDEASGPALTAIELERLEDWVQRWSHSAAANEGELESTRRRLREAQDELARAEAKQRSAARGETRPVDPGALADAKAAYETSQGAEEELATLRRRHEEQRKELEAQPARVGPTTKLAELLQADVSAASQRAFWDAHEARSTSLGRKAQLQRSLEDMPSQPTDSAADLGEREVALKAQRGALRRAEAALRARSTTPANPPPAPPSDTLREWAGVGLLVVIAVILGIQQQWLLCALAGIAAVVAGALQVLRPRAPEVEVTVARPQADAWPEACKAAGLSEDARLDEVQAKLDEVSDELEELGRRIDKAAAAQQLIDQRVAWEDELAALDARIAKQTNALSDVAGKVGLPRDAVPLAKEWFAAAADAQRIQGELAQNARMTAGLSDRIARARDRLGIALGRPLAPGITLQSAMATLQHRSDEAYAAQQRRRDAEAEVAAVRQGVTRAADALAQLHANPGVAESQRDAWTRWARQAGLEADAPTQDLLDNARATAKAKAVRRHLADLEEKLAPLETAICTFEEDLAHAALNLGIENEDTNGRLRALRALGTAEAKREERIAALRAQLTEVELDVERSTLALEEQERRDADRARAIAQFEQWCAQVSAPAELAPGAAPSWLSHIQQAQACIARLEKEKSRRTAIEERIDRFVSEVANLASELGEPSPTSVGDATRLTIDWRTELDVERENTARLEERSKARDHAAREKEGAASRLAEAKQDLAAQLEEQGCANHIEWQELLAANTRRRELKAERAKLTAKMVGALGPQWQLEPEWQRLSTGDVEAWRERATALQARETEAREQLAQHERELAELLAERRSLESSTSVAEIAQQVEVARELLERRKRAWWRLQLGRHLLEHTFEEYRRQRQPAVVRRASEWFAVATDGAYHGIEVDEGSALRFFAAAADGTQHPAEALSSGTTGLMYLCLRLALATDQGHGNEPVPMLLDDVLSHFDPQRAEGALRVLREVSESEDAPQVLLFTCRPEAARMVQDLIPDSGLLGLERWAGGERPAPRLQASTSTSLGTSPANDDIYGAAVALLQRTSKPMSRGDFLEALALSPNDWSSLRRLLEQDPFVEVSGQRRGRAYAWHVDDESQQRAAQ